MDEEVFRRDDVNTRKIVFEVKYNDP